MVSCLLRSDILLTWLVTHVTDFLLEHCAVSRLEITVFLFGMMRWNLATLNFGEIAGFNTVVSVCETLVSNPMNTVQLLHSFV